MEWQLCSADTFGSEQDEEWFNFLKIGSGSGDLKIFHLNFYHRGKFIFLVRESFYRKYLLSLTNADFFFHWLSSSNVWLNYLCFGGSHFLSRKGIFFCGKSIFIH